MAPQAVTAEEKPRASSGTAWRALVLVASVAVGVIFWRSPVLFPLKLLTVMMHESGHAVATLLVGGHVQRVTLGTDESGACLSAYSGGFFASILVYSAGYLGSLIAGLVLCVLALRFHAARATTWLMSAWLIVMGILFAGTPFTFAFCVGTALVLGLLAKFLPLRALEGVSLFIAAFAVLYAVFDLRDDLWDGSVRAVSDAALLANITHVPALVWAVVWSGVSLVLVSLFAKTV